jgi:hypothetical protein
MTTAELTERLIEAVVAAIGSESSQDCEGADSAFFDRQRHIFLPRILGVLMAFAGFGWLTFLFPPLANYLSPYNLVLGFLAELALMLWLLVMGVNVQRWKEQAHPGPPV